MTALGEIMPFGTFRSLSRPPARIAVLLAACAVALAVWVRLGPIPPELLDLDAATSTVVVDRHGVPLYEALSGDGTRSTRLTADGLPPMLVAATIAAEDRRFWRHPGVDPIAVVRAAVHNLLERRIAQGGSTITQQVAKLLLDRRDLSRARAQGPGPQAEVAQTPGWSDRATRSRPRGLTAKIDEAVLALRLEHRFTKAEILSLYLNLAAYGNQLVGAAHASRAYFGREPSSLTAAQAAFLAGLPQRPTVFNPYRRPEAAIARQRVVLRRMQAAGVLTEEEAAHAAEERLAITREAAPFRAPHFVEMVLAQLRPAFNEPSRSSRRHASRGSGQGSGGRALPRARRPVVRTTIDAGLQAHVAGIIRSHRAALTRHGAANVAVVVLDNNRGEWLAWEGSGDYFDERHGGRINGALVPRQPGSALKPFTYALAFEKGLTPASVLPDIASHFPTAEPGILYSPRNYDGRFRGPLLARQALAGSENVPAVALASRIGTPRLLRFLTRAGFSTLTRSASYYGLGLTLGNAEVRLDELVAAYAAFARGGRWLAPTWDLDAERDPASEARPERRLVAPRTAYWIGDVLSDSRAREFIFGRGGWLEFAFPVAVKTGTSQAYHDNWTVGYTREVTVGVWVGNFDRTPLRQSSGVTGAAPIFHAVMLAAIARARGGVPLADSGAIVARPDGLYERRVCALSGMPSTSSCPSRLREWLPVGDETPCTWHRHSGDHVVVAWPQEYRQWALENGLVRQPSSPEVLRVRARRAAPGGALQIASPPHGATYLIDPTLRREFQALPLRAVAPSRVRIDWQVNGRRVGSASSDDAVMWPLEPGTHVIVARDATGRSAETTVVVR